MMSDLFDERARISPRRRALLRRRPGSRLPRHGQRNSARWPVCAALAGVAVAMAIGGCGRSGEHAGAGGSSTAQASGPAKAASPNPSAYLATLRSTLVAATVPTDALVPLGGPAGPKEERPAMFVTTAVCGLTVGPDNDGIHEAYYRQWLGDGWSVQNVVHGYQNTSGAEVVKLVRQNAQSCTQYTDNGLPRRILGPVTLPAYAGVDAQYAYCEEVKGEQTFTGCVAFLARHNLVSYVYVVRGTTQQSSAAGLVQVASLAAVAIGKPG